MPLTPQQLAKIRQKEQETPDALKRNPLNTYTKGWFHVTLNVRDKAPVLGTIVGDTSAPDGSPNAPHCEKTELGKMVETEWRGIGRYYPECVCEEIQVMPEHIHALMHLKLSNKAHLGRIINGIMIGCTHAYWDTLGIPWREMRKQIDDTLKHVWQDRDHTRSFRGPGLLVHGYNDVEAIDEEEIETKRQYIRNNPRKYMIKRERPDVFRVHRNKKSTNWTTERIMKGLCADRVIAADQNKQQEAWRQLTIKGIRNSHDVVSATLHIEDEQPLLDLVGNMELLRRPLYPLVCHRADAHLFDRQKQAVLWVAREKGGVIVTASVSPKEREIVKLLQQELLPVIEVMGEGFNDRYKPPGKAFYAVAENRRLEVTPWEHEYRQREKPEPPDITRQMCMVMNELVRTISQKADDWWKAESPHINIA